MRFPRSVVGWILVVVYCYMVTSAYVSTNGDGWAEINFAILGFPWVFLTYLFPALLYSILDIGDTPYTLLGFIPAFAINALILYWIGLGIQKLFSNMRKKSLKNPDISSSKF